MPSTRGRRHAKEETVKVADLVTIDPEIFGGTPVFKGTRVPVGTLFEYLEGNYSLEEFLDCFPTVSRVAAGALLACSRDALLAAT